MGEKIASQVMAPEEKARARTDTLIRWQIIGTAAGTAIGLAVSIPMGEVVAPFLNLTEITGPLFRLSITSVPAIIGSALGLGMGFNVGAWRSDQLYPIQRPHYPLPKDVSFIAIER